MSQFVVGSTLFPADVQINSPDITLGGNIHTVSIQLTDPAGEWFTKVGHIKQWGVQRSIDGTNWEWGPTWSGDVNDSTKWVPFGSKTKGGGLPFLEMNQNAVVGAVGSFVRLAMITDTDIHLGAIVTTV